MPELEATLAAAGDLAPGSIRPPQRWAAVVPLAKHGEPGDTDLPKLFRQVFLASKVKRNR